MSWGEKIPLNQKAVKLSLKNQERRIRAVLILLLHSAQYSACSSQAKVHYWLLHITGSKTRGWPERCLSSLADRQALLMGTVWEEEWHLKGQTLNVVTSTASGPPQTPLPLWPQVNAVMSDRSTCSSWCSFSLLQFVARSCTFVLMWSCYRIFLFQTQQNGVNQIFRNCKTSFNSNFRKLWHFQPLQGKSDQSTAGICFINMCGARVHSRWRIEARGRLDSAASSPHWL